MMIAVVINHGNWHFPIFDNWKNSIQIKVQHSLIWGRTLLFVWL